MGADPSTGCRKGIRLIYYLQSFCKIIFPDCLDITGYIHVGRTCGNTQAAIQTSVGLRPGFFKRVPPYNFQKTLLAFIGGSNIHGGTLGIKEGIIRGRVISLLLTLPRRGVNTGGETESITVSLYPNVMIAHTQGTGGTYIDTQSAPAAPPVIYPGF